jgi:hypothetical protein
MGTGDLSVTVWRKYGKHRLYVSDSTGGRVGWRDVTTGTDTIERQDRANDFHAAIERHLGVPMKPTPDAAMPDAPASPLPEPAEPLVQVTPKIAGVGGSSAQREYDRRSARERQRTEAEIERDRAWRERVKSERPVLGRLAAAVRARGAIS